MVKSFQIQKHGEGKISLSEKKKLSTGKVWCFAIGQFGWSILSALISSFLVSYYQPDLATQAAGQPIFIPQGLVIFGILTILGAITWFGRIFDAVTDPWIASLSDRCKSKAGRRIPFMRIAAVPFSLVTVLTFWSPVNTKSSRAGKNSAVPVRCPAPCPFFAAWCPWPRPIR